MESRQKEEGFSLIKLETKKCCSDCKTTKTPLWRSGPKSLCNACGIRHRKKNKKVNPRRREWGEVERAALLLMALSCVRRRWKQGQDYHYYALSKHAVERRSWPKFGDAVHVDVGSRLTMVSTEEILLERPGTKPEENKAPVDPLGQGVLMVCRTCGKKGDHWTSRCPYKDLNQQSESFMMDKPPLETLSTTTGPPKGTYVPPSMRPGVNTERTGTDMRRRNEENSVRVINLSEDTREPDLLELFHPFGAVSRVYVAVDQKMGTSRGFGFVNFVSREDAERAINKLNGYGYDNLILRVEWAAPRAN